MLSDLPVPTDPRVLVDFRTADDAGVYALESGDALVQTIDFFTPIVDDPYHYGQIAAANAVSDVYAMGGRPLTALAIAAFPLKDFDPAMVKAIFRGGFEKLREAGVTLLGGHTVQDAEVKFGYAVTGLVSPQAVWTNAGARPGDVLLLTKAIGTGIVATAIKHERAGEWEAPAVASMSLLNRHAAEAFAALGSGAVHACTDITGFALLGHAVEMAESSGVTLVVERARVPFLPGAEALAARNRTGGGAANAEYFGPRVGLDPAIDDDHRALLYDPQTSGGLLVALDPAREREAISRVLGAGGLIERIGRVEARSASAVRVT